MALARESRQFSSIRWGRPEMRSRLQEAGLAACTSSMALYTSYRLWERPHSSSKSYSQHLNLHSHCIKHLYGSRYAICTLSLHTHCIKHL